MDQIEQIANAALRRDSLRLRSLVQDFLRSGNKISEIPQPLTDDQEILALSAALLELLAMRKNQSPPVWTANVGSRGAPFYLLAAAEHMQHLRRLCREEAPEPLRKRGYYAPPDYLTFA